MAHKSMMESLVSKQDQAEEFQIVSITYRKQNPTSSFQISTRLNCYGPICEHFGGLVDIATNICWRRVLGHSIIFVIGL
jgi:hypothetical protein